MAFDPNDPLGAFAAVTNDDPLGGTGQVSGQRVYTCTFDKKKSKGKLGFTVYHDSSEKPTGAQVVRLDSPVAKRVGVLKGSHLVSIDGTDVSEVPHKDILTLLRGNPKGKMIIVFKEGKLSKSMLKAILKRNREKELFACPAEVKVKAYKGYGKKKKKKRKLKDIDEWLEVVVPEGVLMRTGHSFSTPVCGTLDVATLVHAIQQLGRRVKLDYPAEGWVSVHTKKKEKCLHRTDKRPDPNAPKPKPQKKADLKKLLEGRTDAAPPDSDKVDYKKGEWCSIYVSTTESWHKDGRVLQVSKDGHVQVQFKNGETTKWIKKKRILKKLRPRDPTKEEDSDFVPKKVLTAPSSPAPRRPPKMKAPSLPKSPTPAKQKEEEPAKPDEKPEEEATEEATTEPAPTPTDEQESKQPAPDEDSDERDSEFEDGDYYDDDYDFFAADDKDDAFDQELDDDDDLAADVAKKRARKKKKKAKMNAGQGSDDEDVDALFFMEDKTANAEVDEVTKDITDIDLNFLDEVEDTGRGLDHLLGGKAKKDKEVDLDLDMDMDDIFGGGDDDGPSGNIDDFDMSAYIDGELT